MNCPKCEGIVPDRATQCPACGSALQSPDLDATWVGIAEPAPISAQAATANDVTVAAPMSRPSSNAGSDAVTSPQHFRSAAPPRLDSSDGVVDFGLRYRVDRLLGQGGMGAVYLAYDQDLGPQVALKLVKPELMIYPGAMERFRQELLLASKISHRNILRIHDLGDAGGMKFISMAYLDGEDLHQVLVRELTRSGQHTTGLRNSLCLV